MTQKLLAFVIITLVIIAPTLCSDGMFKYFWRVLSTWMEFGVGSKKFYKEFFRFQTKELPDTDPTDLQVYDFIVVGAGSAGATIASRLSEIEDIKVLLIEAGGPENFIMNIPFFALLLQETPINWAYLTEPSTDYCLGMINHQCRIAKGKVMGGTSTINYMIAIRGNKHDYDEWAEMTGDNEWSYASMLKYLKKLERFEVKSSKYEEEYHNFDGPVRIANPPFRTPLAAAFVKAGEELGFPPVDYNGRSQTGFSHVQANQVNGERLSANRAYLHHARNRTNLFVSMNSHVSKVLISAKTKEAYGVEYVKRGKKLRVLARKEVILSAGAIASPQLLMLSGIGPAEHLRNLGIQVLRDAPVGENMMDHIAYGGLFFLVNDTVGVVASDFWKLTNPTAADWLYRRTGHLSTLAGVEGLGYVNVDDPFGKNDLPTIELMFGAGSPVSYDKIHSVLGITEEHWIKYFADKLDHHAYMIWPLLMKPKSRGKVLLRSADPMAKPRLLANYLSHPDDVKRSIKGIRMAIQVSRTKAMQRYGSRVHNYTVPGCESEEFYSDAYWECALRTYTMSLWHHSGTCKMGMANDSSAVVNSKLQVIGVKRLRVADASIMPNIVTAHTNIPTIAIGEKFADILKSDWGYINR